MYAIKLPLQEFRRLAPVVLPATQPRPPGPGRLGEEGQAPAPRHAERRPAALQGGAGCMVSTRSYYLDIAPI